MAKLDEGQHQLQFSIAVIGGASDRFTSALAIEGDTLTLPELQGWRPRLRFFVFGIDPWAEAGADADELNRHLPELDALVLTDAPDLGRHYSSSLLERLERALHLGRDSLPTAIFGGTALAEEWASLTGYRPLYVGEPVADNALPALKTLVRAMLKSTSRPPPPIAE
jgi:hypothetical protein